MSQITVLKKERKNLEHAENLYQQARKRYYEAQETYAHFADANQSLSLKLYQKELYNLQIAKDIAYKEYTETLQQLQFAKIRVYKKRPVFAIIEPATVPLSPVSPSKIKILSVIFLLSLAMGCGWIYFKTMPCSTMIKKIYKLLSERQQKRSVAVMFMVLLRALLDFAGVAALIPVLLAILEPDGSREKMLTLCCIILLFVMLKNGLVILLARMQSRFLLDIIEILAGECL